MTPVPYIEYVNTRIRGCYGRRITRDAFEMLLAGDNLGTVTTYLLNHPEYREDVETALEGVGEREGLEKGVTRHFTQTVGGILAMAEGRVRLLFETALHSFDMKNLRVVLLARHRQIPFDDLAGFIVPCGSLTLEHLRMLCDAPDTATLIRLLEPVFPAAAKAFRAALGENGGDILPVRFINRMEGGIYGAILDQLRRGGADTAMIRDLVSFEIDLRNITSALKHAWEHLPADREDFAPFIPGGTVSIGVFEAISAAKELDEAFELVDGTPFREAVEKGIIYFAESGYLHELERFFEEVFIRRTQRHGRFEPFGIGVFVSFVWAQYVELTNLRTIINGIAFRSGAGQIRKGVIYV